MAIDEEGIRDVPGHDQLLLENVLSEGLRKENAVSLAFVHWLKDPDLRVHPVLGDFLGQLLGISWEQETFGHEVKMLGPVQFFHSLNPHTEVVLSCKF